MELMFSVHLPAADSCGAVLGGAGSVAAASRGEADAGDSARRAAAGPGLAAGGATFANAEAPVLVSAGTSAASGVGPVAGVAPLAGTLPATRRSSSANVT